MSLDSIVADVRLLEKGMEMVRNEFHQQKDSVVLTGFVSKNGALLDSVVKDSKTAQVPHETSRIFVSEHDALRY